MQTITQKNIKYFYEHKSAKNGDICLATKDPTKYCNGIYKYSDKDPGSGKKFVVIKQVNISEERNNLINIIIENE